MQSIAVAFPVAPGKTDAVHRFVEELASGDRAMTHHENRRQHGFQRIKVFRQHRPFEMVIVYLEAHDLEEAMVSRAEEDHEFEQWFEDTIRELHGYHLTGYGGAASELLLDWHPQHGASRKAHPV